MVKSKFTPIVVLFTVIVFSPVWVQEDIPLSSEGMVPGHPFQILQD